MAPYRCPERAAERLLERNKFGLRGAAVGLTQNGVERFVEREWHLTRRWQRIRQRGARGAMPPNARPASVVTNRSCTRSTSRVGTVKLLLNIENMINRPSAVVT